MTQAYWFEHGEQGGFPVLRAAVGDCDLSVLHVGGEWQWLVRRDGRDIAEGAARNAVEARQAAEAVALKRMLDDCACF
jgi:hypothetical protein